MQFTATQSLTNGHSCLTQRTMDIKSAKAISSHCLRMTATFNCSYSYHFGQFSRLFIALPLSYLVEERQLQFFKKLLTSDNPVSTATGHPYKLYTSHCTSIHSRFFAHRIIKAWNSLCSLRTSRH